MGGAVSVPLATSIAIPVVGGIIISNLTRDSLSGWYQTLDKPGYNPPGAVFGPAWAVLYTLMGIASYQVYHVAGLELGSRALKLYATQLGLNFLWPLVFFNARKLGLSVLVNLALLVTSVATCGAFYKLRPEAGQLLLPYIAWLLFANVLNIAVWRRNPHANEVEKVVPKRDNTDPGKDGYGPTGPAGKPATASLAAGLHRPRRIRHVSSERLQLQAPRTLRTQLPLRRPATPMARLPQMARMAAAPATTRSFMC